MNRFVPFDSARRRVLGMLQTPGALPANLPDLYLVRDLFGKVRLSISDEAVLDDVARDGLERLTVDLHQTLGARAYPAEQTLLSVDRKRAKWAVVAERRSV